MLAGYISYGILVMAYWLWPARQNHMLAGYEEAPLRICALPRRRSALRRDDLAHGTHS